MKVRLYLYPISLFSPLSPLFVVLLKIFRKTKPGEGHGNSVNGSAGDGEGGILGQCLDHGHGDGVNNNNHVGLSLADVTSFVDSIEISPMLVTGAGDTVGGSPLSNHSNSTMGFHLLKVKKRLAAFLP